MKTSSVTVDILSAIIILGCAGRAFAQQDGVLWRLRRDFQADLEARDPLPENHDGPALPERGYSFPPPYGYPPRSTNSEEESVTYITVHVTDTVTGKCSVMFDIMQ